VIDIARQLCVDDSYHSTVAAAQQLLKVSFRCYSGRKSFCFHRLSFLTFKFNTYKLLNELDEVSRMQKTSHRDFYNIRKV